MYFLRPIKTPEHCCPELCSSQESVAVRPELDTGDAATAGHARPDGVALAVPDHLHHGLICADGQVPTNHTIVV